MHMNSNVHSSEMFGQILPSLQSIDKTVDINNMTIQILGKLTLQM